jgi:hypothetical protein
VVPDFKIGLDPLTKEIAETQKLQGAAVSEPPKPMGGQWAAVSLKSSHNPQLGLRMRSASADNRAV